MNKQKKKKKNKKKLEKNEFGNNSGLGLRARNIIWSGSESVRALPYDLRVCLPSPIPRPKTLRDRLLYSLSHSAPLLTHSPFH